VIRPGPERLAPAVAPGGVVLHVYDARGTRLLARTLTPTDEPELLGALDAERIGDLMRAAQRDGPLVLVVFDGDTGERHPAWVGIPSGTQLDEATP
jgi:hypothetical protein